MTGKLDNQALDQLYRAARARNGWTGRARGARAMEEFQEVKMQIRVVAPTPLDHPRTQTS